MPAKRLKAWLPYCVIALTMPLLVGGTDQTSNFDARVLAAHNRERTASGIAPPRERGADHLAATGAFYHAPERPWNPEGENLWAGTHGYYSAEAMVDGWIREKRFFKAGAFPNNSVTGQVADVGHYTQIMWRQSGEVGCARARGWNEDFLVCRYAEAGNYLGEKPF